MNIPFWKMHGAGNDFILADDRSRSFPAQDAAWLARIAARRTGIGSDGVILIQPSAVADFRMRFFNPDGREADMCGNGARCVARLAHAIQAAPACMTIETAAGLLHAEILPGNVRLGMTTPKDWRMNLSLRLGDRDVACRFVNSGVPHAVVRLASPDDLRREDVHNLGRQIRHHAAFAPAGANANFIAVTGPNQLAIRTYERGVEAETLACGTGIVAAALVAAHAGWVAAPVQIATAGGDTLTVAFDLSADTADNVTLTGPAVFVFEGTVSYPA